MMCQFCEDLAEAKASTDQLYPKAEHEYVVSLIDRKSESGRPVGITAYGHFPLNYCPVCGKNLKGETP